MAGGSAAVAGWRSWASPSSEEEGGGKPRALQMAFISVSVPLVVENEVERVLEVDLLRVVLGKLFEFRSGLRLACGVKP